MRLYAVYIILFISFFIAVWSLYSISRIEFFNTASATTTPATGINFFQRFNIVRDTIRQKLYTRSTLQSIDNIIYNREENDYKLEEQEYKRESKDCVNEAGPWTDCKPIPGKCTGTNEFAEGTQTREIKIKQVPVNGGKGCPLYETTQNCTFDKCPVDCVGVWENVGECEVQCPDPNNTTLQEKDFNVEGKQKQKFRITKEAKYNGSCPVANGAEKYIQCPKQCPINCYNKVDESGCSAKCESGNHSGKATGTKTRTVTRMRENRGSSAFCEAPASTPIPCDIPCPIPDINCEGYWDSCKNDGCGLEGTQSFIVTKEAIGAGTCENKNKTQACYMNNSYGNFPANKSFIFRVKNDVNKSYCLHPEGGGENPGNGTKLLTWEDCSAYDRLRFRTLGDGQLQHVKSGKCLHTENRNIDIGTIAHLWDNCDDSIWGNQYGRLRYKFIPNGDSSGKIQLIGVCPNRYLKVDNKNSTSSTLKLSDDGSDFYLEHVS